MAGTHSGACVVVVAYMWGFPLQEEAVKEQNCLRTATVCGYVELYSRNEPEI